MTTDEERSLPKGWTFATLDELISPDGVFIDGDWVESKDQDANGEIRLIQLADVGDGIFRDKSNRRLTKKMADELDCTFLRKGDVLVARMPEPLGRCCIFPLEGEERYVTVVDVCVIRLPHSSADPKYVMQLLNSPQIRAEMASYQAGSTRKRISRGNLAKVRLPMAPLDEQPRIVAKLEELFSELGKGVDGLATAGERITTYRQALLKHAFEGKLTEAWRNSNRALMAAPAAMLHEISEHKGRDISSVAASAAPDTWRYVRAEDVCAFITKGTTPNKELLHDRVGDVPFVKVYNLTTSGQLDFSVNPTFIDRKTHGGALARSKVYPGDVLMNIVGPPLGKVSVVPATFPEWNINQAIAFFRTTFLKPRLLAYYLGYEGTLRALERKAKATAGQFNLTLEICRDIPLPIFDRNEQEFLESLLDERLSQLASLEANIASNISRCYSLKRAILTSAFSGQLVAQDPKVESESVLLEHIRTEHESSVGKKESNPKSGKSRRKRAA